MAGRARILDMPGEVAPDHRTGRELLADAFEQLGDQAESAPWRTFYLTGAEEPPITAC